MKYLKLVKQGRGVIKNQISEKEINEIKNRYGFMRDCREYINLAILLDYFPTIPEFFNVFYHCWIFYLQMYN